MTDADVKTIREMVEISIRELKYRLAEAIMNKQNYVCPDLPEGFSITFHAGAEGTKENSLESVQFSVDNNADIAEFDVTFRQDGTPVIIHSDHPGDDEGESFEEALKIVATHPSCRINLDLKNVSNLPVVDELVGKYGLTDRVFYTGVENKWADTVKKNSAIKYYLNHGVTPEESLSRKAAEKLAEEIKTCGAIGLNSHFLNASKLVCDVMHENGLLVSFWTVNELPDMERILKVGPDNITTRCPFLLRELVSRK